jgi:hypothetical protein
MLGPHLSSLQGQINVILPRPRGGVAPSRREVALADYIEKQRAHRQPEPFSLGNSRVGTVLWNTILRACRAAIPVLWHSKRVAARTGPNHGATVSRPKSTAGRSAYRHQQQADMLTLR